MMRPVSPLQSASTGRLGSRIRHETIQASAIAKVEYANGLVMLEGDKRMKEAEALYAEAAAMTPMDAMERLDIEMAKAELED